MNELNLQTRKAKLFKLTLVDGRIISIRKPSAEMIGELEDLERQLVNEKNFMNAFGIIKQLVLKILNRNTTNVVYDLTFLEQMDENGEREYDYDVCMIIYKSYTEFYKGILTDPN